MNPGWILLPFLAVLLQQVWTRGGVLFGIWSFICVALPTVRNSFGPVSIYWSDVAALAVLFWIARGRQSTKRWTLDYWMVFLVLALSIGGFSAFARYGAYLEPGFTLLRYVLALVPLMAVPRIVGAKDGTFEWLLRGLVVGAIALFLMALAQSASPSTALWLEQRFYGDFSGDYRERLIEGSDTLRVYGMYSTSTCFAGAATMLGVLLLLLQTGRRRGWMLLAGAGGCLVASLLTYSRHALVAWAVFSLLAATLRPGKFLRTAGVAVGVLVASSSLISLEFWEERIDRGGVESDENLSSRLVDRPLELLDRIQEEPSVGLVGVGLGVDHVGPAVGSRPSRYGFVSNGFLLFLFYGGIVPFLAYCGVFALSCLRALGLETAHRATAVGAIGAVVVVVASDNYGFLHLSIPFMWSTLLALVFSLPIKRYPGVGHLLGVGRAECELARDAAARQREAGPSLLSPSPSRAGLETGAGSPNQGLASSTRHSLLR